MRCQLGGSDEVMISSPRLVMVHWIDAFDSSNGWITLKEHKPKAQHVYQCGFVCDDVLDGYLSLTGCWCPEPAGMGDDVGMITHIPLAMVQRVVELAVPEWGRSYPEGSGFDAT